MTKSNQYSIFNSRDSIPKNRKCECTNEAQTLVVWAFSNFDRNLRTIIFKKSIINYHNKDTILSDMDSLDYEDKHYQRRKTDLENRLYKTYDKIE